MPKNDTDMLFEENLQKTFTNPFSCDTVIAISWFLFSLTERS